jgi:amino acid transporter
MSTDLLFRIGVGIVIGLVFGFVPTIIALARNHPERRLLAQLNVLGLVSTLLWVALLVWAIGGKRDDSVIGRFVADAGNRRPLIILVGVLFVGGLATTAYALAHQ